MLIVANRKELVKALTVASRVSPRLSHKPILQHALLAADLPGAWLAATDLQVGLRIDLVNVRSENIQSGRVTLPIARTLAALKGWDCDYVLIQSAAEGHNVTLRGAHGAEVTVIDKIN